MKKSGNFWPRVWILAGVMGMTVPITVLASEPEFARTTEEWERLRDNTLEYGEIEDLIHEYNVTVQNNQYEYTEFIKDYGKTRDEVADSYRELADELEASMTGEDGTGMISDFQLEQQAKQMREQADNTVEDSYIYYLTYSQAEDSLVLSAQSKFLSYYKSQEELESALCQKKILENSYALTLTQRQAGAATDMDVLNALEAVQSQEKTIQELEQQIENTRQSLIVMCGWSAGSQPHIDTVPEWSREEIDAADPDSDLQQALENNYTLRINKRKLENTLDADNKAQLERTISGNERQIELSIQNAWQNLQTAERSYDQAVSAKLLEEENYTLAGQKKDAGIITEYEYESAGLTLQMKESAVRIASLELIEALESYRWKVNGLASAE